MKNIGANSNGQRGINNMTTAVMTQTQFVNWLKNSIGKKYDFDG